MTILRGISVVFLCAVAPLVARAIELPETCEQANPYVNQLEIDALKARVVDLFESAPTEVVDIICATIPRVEEAYGPDSAEMAWWVGSLATPLIAYLDRHDEAIPLLEFALPIYKRELGPHADEVADVYVAYAWINFRRGLLKEAGEAWQQALTVREHNPGLKQIELQKVLVGLAQVQLSRREFEKARATLQRAQAILAENAETVSEAAAAIENALTNLALREENYALGRIHAERQLEIERKLNRSTAQLVTANVAYAQILERLDEYPLAEARLREAIELSEADQNAPLQRHRLTALTQLADSLNRRGEAQAAVTFADRAVEVGSASIGLLAPRMVNVYDVRAEIAHTLGDWPAAIDNYRHADTIMQTHPDDVEAQVAVAHFRGKGALYATLGDFVLARQALRRALAIAEHDASLSTELAQTYVALSHLTSYFSPDRQAMYLAQARQSLSLRLPEGHPDILQVVAESCMTQVRGTDAPACDDARRLMRTASNIDPMLASRLLASLAERALFVGKSQEAWDYALASLAKAGNRSFADYHWRSLYLASRVLYQRGDHATAILLGKQAIIELERLRGSFIRLDTEFERGFIADKTEVYRQLADWLFIAGRIDEGVEVLGLLRTEELSEMLVRGDQEPEDSSPVSLTARERELYGRYLAIVQPETSGENHKTIDTTGELNRLLEIRTTERLSVAEKSRYEELIDQQSMRTPVILAALGEWFAYAGQTLGYSRTPAAPDTSRTFQLFQHRFETNAVLAMYLVTPAGIRTVVASRNGVENFYLPIPRAQIRQEVGHFIRDITARADVNPLANALYQRVFQQVDRVAQANGSSRIILWPDDVLRYVPFAALHDGAQFVSSVYELQVFSGAAQEALPGRSISAVRALGSTKGATKGSSDKGERQAPLPGVLEELCAIVDGPVIASDPQINACGDRTPGLIPGRGYIDAAFTRSLLRYLLLEKRDFDVLHISTHFALSPGNAVRSRLLLGDGGEISLDDVARLDFSGIELVALSACETGMSATSADDGREVEALSALVLRRGARRVLASLWPVEDQSTVHMMTELYRALRNGQTTVAQALKQSAQTLRQSTDFQHPYYWAGFYVASAHR